MAVGGIALTDRDNQQAIELFIDQQVFIDVVRGNEQVDEFAAHTEVTTFERRGSDLYLEGNILFTAYLDASAQPPEANQQGSPPDGTPRADVEHLQHRMPFDLSVPVAAQSAGLFSVQVQVPEATVDVLGPGWLHIRAVLRVEGLPQNGGYAAHCGAQEEVVPAFPNGLTGAPVSPFAAYGQPADEQSTEAQSNDGQPNHKGGSQPFDYSDLLAPFSVTEPSTPPAWDTFAPTGHFSDHQDTERPALEAGSTRDATSEDADDVESSLSESGWKQQLQGADRALHGVNHTPFETIAPADAENAKEATKEATKEAAEHRSGSGFHPFRTGQPPRPEAAPEFSAARTFADGDGSGDESPHLSYHFEHTQLDGAESPGGPNTPDTPDTPGSSVQGLADGSLHTDAGASPRAEWMDDMIPAMPFSGDPLRAESPDPQSTTPIPPEVERSAPPAEVEDTHRDASEIAAHASVQTHQEVVETVDPAAMQMSYAAVPEEAVALTAAEWFWKTMNVPTGETSFTMKFRIVQVTETVEDIANYYNVSVAELLRANEMTMDASIEGSLLYIPVMHS